MLHPDSFYHIYNHANGSENLFRESRNYYFFLDRAKVHLLPYMKLYAYCLMPNHFHLLVRIKSESDIKAIFAGVESFHQLKSSEKDRYLSKKISKSISNLCSSYTQSINKVYQRKGSLFMPNFKSNEIRHENDFCKVVHYIHANPVHHRFVSAIDQWKYSSFHTFLSDRETSLERGYVIEVFGSEKFFRDYHEQPIPAKNVWHDA